MNAARKILTLVSATAVLGVVTVISATPTTQAAVSVGGYSGYTPETFAADTAAQGALHASLEASAASAAAAGDFADANGGEGGSSAHCSVRAFKPRGYFDDRNYTVHVEVIADVWCNFTSPEIRVKVILQGHEGSRSVGQPSPDVTCTGASACTAIATYSRQMYCSENFHFEHYGRPYGSYRLKNGSWRTLVGDGVQGPSPTGGAYRYC